MAWTPLPDQVTIQRTLDKFLETSADGSAGKMQLVAMKDGQPLAGGSTKVLVGGSVVTVPDGEWYAKVGGSYSLDVLGFDAEGVALKRMRTDVLVSHRFRKYLVPDGYVVVDVDKPIRSGKVYVKNGGTVTFTVLHPDFASVDTDTGIVVHPGCTSSWFSTDRLTNGSLVYKQSFTFSVPSNRFDANGVLEIPGCYYYLVESGATYKPFPLLPDDFTIVVLNQHVPSLSFDTHVDPVELKSTYRSLRFTGVASGTVRAIGAIGSVSGTVEGTRKEYTNPPSGTSVDVEIPIEDYVSGEPTNVTGVDPVSSAPDADRLRIELSLSPPTQVGSSNPNYAWKTINLNDQGTLRFHLLPLGFNPTDVPVYKGKDSVLPIRFCIEDTTIDFNNQTSSCPVPVTLRWTDEGAGCYFVIPRENLSAGLSFHRTFREEVGNPLETNTVYTLYVIVPGRAKTGLNKMTMNAQELFTLSTRSLYMAMPWDDQFRRLVHWASLGNFTWVVDGEDNETDTPYRAWLLATEAMDYYVAHDQQDNVKDYLQTGYGACGSVANTVAYICGCANWMSCIDDWLPKAPMSWVPGWQSDSALAGSQSGYGFDIGLPFGTATSYYSGGRAFQVERTRVSLLFAVDMNGILNGPTGNVVPGSRNLNANLQFWGHGAAMIMTGAGRYRTWDSYSDKQPIDANKGKAAILSKIIGAKLVDKMEIFDCHLYVNRKGNLSYEYTSPALPLPHPECPILPQPNQMVSWDPTSATPDVIRNASYTEVGVYNANEAIPYNTTVEDEGWVTRNPWYGEVIYRGIDVLWQWDSVLPAGANILDDEFGRFFVSGMFRRYRSTYVLDEPIYA